MFYEILGVRPDASEPAIRRAFRERAKRLHPDAPGGGAEEMVVLNRAYEVLRDPERRRSYDATLARPLPPRPAPPRRPGADPLLYLATVFKPLDARLRKAASTLLGALEELAYDVYDDAYMTRFAESVADANRELGEADAALRGVPWPAGLESPLGLYAQGLRQIEDALGDFETFGLNYDVDLLAMGRDILDQGVSLLDEAIERLV